MELLRFSDYMDNFTELNCKLIAASCDSQYTQLAFINTLRVEGGIDGIRFPVIADFSKSIARSYNLLLDNGIPLRGMFIISPTGILKHMTINDIPIGRNVEEAIRLVKAHKIVDESDGELCIPVDWTADKKPIKFHPTLFLDAYKVQDSASPRLTNINTDLTATHTAHSDDNAPQTVSSLIEDVDSGRRFNEIISVDKLIVCSYWAPWCKNCKKIRPVLEEMAKEGSVIFFRVNTTFSEDIATQQSIDALPTFQCFKKGVQVKEFKGSNLDKLKAYINENK
jgi:alkyl hydroperoxide reductase subunit AhpC/thiol-disulfide isomerase/thioredoxin